MSQFIVGYRITDDKKRNALCAALAQDGFDRLETTSLWIRECRDSPIGRLHRKYKGIVGDGDEVVLLEVDLLDSEGTASDGADSEDNQERKVAGIDQKKMARNVALRWLLSKRGTYP
jgi:hypothetical protein